MDTNLHPPKGIEIALDQVTAIISRHCSLIGSYCFGVRSRAFSRYSLLPHLEGHQFQSFHFFLLLVAERLPGNATANLMNLISKETENEHHVTLLCYTPKQIAASNDQQRQFFKAVLQSGWLVHGKPLDPKKLNLIKLGGLDPGNTVNYCQNRLVISETFLSNAAENIHQPLTAAYMLHTAMEQLCLGLIYAFLNYHPRHFHIGYLLDLSSLITEIPQRLFSRNSYTEAHFRGLLLSTNYHDLRYRPTGLFTLEDVKVLHHCCLAFRYEITPLIKKRLFTLKSFDHENGKENAIEKADQHLKKEF